MLARLATLVVLLCIGVYGVPRGHLKPLGQHRDPDTSVREVEVRAGHVVAGGIAALCTVFVQGWPSVATLYYEHIVPGIPIVMRNAAKYMKAYKKWDDAYMKRVAGDVLMTIEAGKKEDRTLPSLQRKLSWFLDNYQNPKHKANTMYLVNDLPEKALSEDMAFPEHMKKLMVTANPPALWFSSGGTKSVLHNDQEENWNCLIHGKKDFVVIDKRYEKEVYESTKYSGYGNRCPFDVEKVDLIKWPLFKFVPWYNVTLHGGDCFYIPKKWYHSVHSYGPRNLAVNVWFSPPARVEDINDHGPGFSTTPLADLPNPKPFSDRAFWQFKLPDDGDEDEEDDGY